MASDDFGAYMRSEGLSPVLVEELILQGCDNQWVFASLHTEDLMQLRRLLPLQKNKLRQLHEAAKVKPEPFGQPDPEKEFEAYLLSQGLSQQTIECLQQQGCINSRILVSLSDSDIDKIKDILPFQKRRLQDVMRKTRPEGKPFINVVKDEDEKMGLHIKRAVIKAHNIAPGCRVEGFVQDMSTVDDDITIDSIQIDARNLTKGSTVTGVKVTARTDTTGPSKKAALEFLGEDFPFGATCKSYQASPHTVIRGGSSSVTVTQGKGPSRTVTRDGTGAVTVTENQGTRVQCGAVPVPPVHFPPGFPFESTSIFQPAPPAQPQYRSYQEMPDVVLMSLEKRDIAVTPSTTDFFRQNAFSPQVYRMTQQIRGRCLVFNSMPERAGNNVDMDKLAHLFARLHFQVKVEKEPKYETILKRLTRYREYSLRQRRKPQCLVVNFVAECTPEGVRASDGRIVPYEAIYGEFQGEAAKGLEGLPKLFVFHAPRTNSRDEMLLADEASRPSPGDDMIAIFPTNEAYASWVDKSKGSWYVEGITRIFTDFACNEDIGLLFTRVNDLVSRKVSKDGMGIMTDVQDKLTKKLYFFPGVAIPPE